MLYCDSTSVLFLYDSIFRYGQLLDQQDQTLHSKIWTRQSYPCTVAICIQVTTDVDTPVP
eukprot:1911604-Rhodomonas_salina.3